MPEIFCRKCKKPQPTYPDVISGQRAERCAVCNYPVSYGETIKSRKIDKLDWDEGLDELKDSLRNPRKRRGMAYVEWLILLAVICIAVIVAVGRRLI